MIITTLQVILFFLVATVGMMGAFCLFCFTLIQIAEPVSWLVFGKMVIICGGAILIYWAWWKCDVLGTKSATDRFFRRKVELQQHWMRTSTTYQVIIVILTVATMLYTVFQGRNLRHLTNTEVHRDSDPPR